MFSPIASTIFTYRNFDKTEKGEIGRAPVFIGQAAGVLSEVAKYDNAIAVGAKNALSVFGDLAQGNKALDYAGKFAKFASENVNPLIAVSGGIKVLMSDDKQSTAIKEAAALSAMFAGEGLVKNYYDKLANSNAVQSALKSASNKKFIKPVVEFLAKKKWGGAVGAIFKGLLFVAASMSSYEIGHLAGDKIAKKVKDYQAEKNAANAKVVEEKLREFPVAQTNLVA